MIDQWYQDNLVCPVEKSSLKVEGNFLVSREGRRYPVVDGIPVMLVEEAEQTIGVAADSLRCARKAAKNEEGNKEDLYLDTLGISKAEKEGLRALNEQDSAKEVDPVVAYLIGATSGNAYKSVIGTLGSYPIPELRLPHSEGEVFLDVGCSWGRWSIAAAQKGYKVVGIDPSLGAIKAARRVSREFALTNRYIVADARYLPFRSSAFDSVFSYSVLQHFSRADARASLDQIALVLKARGRSLIQMANAWGIRSLYHRARRGFRPARAFEVRYWTVPELRKAFESIIGDSSIHVDCFFGLGLQESDIDLMSSLGRFATRVSSTLRNISDRITPLRYLADSVYVSSRVPV